ncbi:MAG: hypothetical protein ACMUIE_06430 [Thermoplasmatota archaeon]
MARNTDSKGQSRNKMYSRTKPKAMLNLGKLDYFNYDLKEIMDSSDMDDNKRPSFMATLTARARQRSIKEAKDYISEVEERGDISRDLSDRLRRLLDRYSKYR